MMETPNTLNSGMCRCCSSEGTFKDIKTKYHWMGEEEIYADMLTDCFDIKIQTPEDMDNGICEVCITQLRNAVNFKKQVLHTEEQFKRRLQGRDIKNPIKIESLEESVDSDHLSDPDFGEEYEVPIKQEEEDKPKPKKRAAKPAATRAKKSKTEAETSAQRVARRTRIITIDATNQNAGIKLAIAPNVMRLPKVGRSETMKNLHNLDFPRHTSVVKAPLDTSHCGSKLPIIVATRSLKKLTTMNMRERSKISLDNKAKRGADLIKYQENLEIVLRYSNATPFLGQRGIDYACYFCTQRFPEPDALKRHTFEFHDDFKRDPSLPPLRSDNYSVKIDVTDLTCQICLTTYAHLTNLMTHLRVDHNQPIHTDIKDAFLPFRFDSKPLKCASCDSEYTLFRMLLEHMNKHYRNYVCNICDTGFITKVGLRTHKKSHEDGDYQCDLCHKVYNSYTKLNMHNRCVHLGLDKRYKCSYCGERFSSIIGKNNHQVETHGVLHTVFKCKACDKTFRSNQGLREHRKIYHLMIKKFKCTDCDMAFPSSGDLKDHMVKHTGVRDFRCQICQKAFGRRMTLVQHMRSHNNERRHKCEHCLMAFVQKCSLKSHLLSRHGIGIKKEKK